MENTFSLYRASGTTLFSKRLFPAAEEELRRWLQSSEQSCDYVQSANAANALGACFSSSGRYAKALEFYSVAEESLERCVNKDADLALKILANRAYALWARGETDRALGEINKFLDANDHVNPTARLLLMRGGLELERGSLDQAELDLSNSAKLYSQQGNVHLAAMATSNLAIVYGLRGELSLAKHYLELAFHELVMMRDHKNAAYTLTEMALLAQGQNDFAKALEYCSQSLKHLLSDITTLDRREVANVCRVLAMSFRNMGDVQRADNYARRALNFYRNQVNPYIIEQGRIFEHQYKSAVHSTSKDDAGGQSSFYQWEHGLNYIEASLSMIDTTEQMDQYTVGHSSRVMGYCAIMADQLKLNTLDRESLLFAARFHDLGKVCIPQDILTKAGSLNESEWVLMRRHPSVGADMVRLLIPDSPAADIIQGHHERYDGLGYPSGLAKDAIPLTSHILSLADAYDAMTSNRAYRSAMTHSRAMNVLHAESGQQFHPIIVDAWHKLHQV